MESVNCKSEFGTAIKADVNLLMRKKDAKQDVGESIRQLFGKGAGDSMRVTLRTRGTIALHQETIPMQDLDGFFSVRSK